MIKKAIPWIIFGSLLGLMIFVLTKKDDLTQFMSEVIQNQLSLDDAQFSLNRIDSLYNYSTNKEPYKITFLEFGATGCSTCKRMEPVMEEIRRSLMNQVNVVFVNTLLPENIDLVRYFGIAAIPTQVLLDINGEEYFRHTGYLSATDLAKEFYD